MTIFRFSVAVWALAVAGCSSSEQIDDTARSELAELREKIRVLEKRLGEEEEKSSRILNIVTSEIRREGGRQREQASARKSSAMDEFLEQGERSAVERRLDALERKDFLRSQGIEK